MICEPFSIVVVPFPFTDMPQIKKRPALVLSNVEYQQQTSHATLLMITTAKNSAWENDYLIHHLQTTGLAVRSIIRQKIFTLDSGLIIKSIGALSSEDRKQVVKRLKEHLPI